MNRNIRLNDGFALDTHVGRAEEVGRARDVVLAGFADVI